MARKQNREERRAEIVQALLRVMAHRGYERATVQAIAKEAGLTPGLLHYHFGSKQEILVALVGTIAEVSEQRLAALLAEAEGPDARLAAYLRARLGMGPGAAPEIVAAWVMVGAEAVRQPEVRQVYQRVMAAELRRAETLISEGLAASVRRTEGANAIAAGLVALMQGAFLLASAAPETLPVGYALGQARAYVDAAIAEAPMAAATSTQPS
ncbi:MAG: TetR family transcriptional regulator [Deltaproteobacteria bacterium]|nr:TetR family transcriptional regulator [Deltaproteobacteria bacterium]